MDCHHFLLAHVAKIVTSQPIYRIAKKCFLWSLITCHPWFPISLSEVASESFQKYYISSYCVDMDAITFQRDYSFFCSQSIYVLESETFLEGQIDRSNVWFKRRLSNPKICHFPLGPISFYKKVVFFFIYHRYTSLFLITVRSLAQWVMMCS